MNCDRGFVQHTLGARDEVLVVEPDTEHAVDVVPDDVQYSRGRQIVEYRAPVATCAREQPVPRTEAEYASFVHAFYHALDSARGEVPLSDRSVARAYTVGRQVSIWTGA